MPDERPLTMHATDILTKDSYSEHSSEDKGADLLKHSQQDAEKQAVEEEGQTEQAKKKSSSTAQFISWTVINTLATIAIVSSLVASSAQLIEQVFTNKEIFKDRSLKRNQSTFAAFHFTVTAATLWYVSKPSWGMFVPQRAGLVQMLPLGIAMCLNVIFPNLSLAYSSVAFYQIVRVLLTPLVAIINFAFYGAQMPRKAVYTLLPICLGVGIVSYYDTQPRKGKQVHSSQTSLAGVLFAFSGVIASSLYTVWIGTYHKKFKLNSMQLLFNQAPISAFLLLYVIPFTDQSPNWSRLEGTKWVLILFSGLMASLINISQFFIVAGAGPVSSTVVGHLKTCSIVVLGWITSDRGANDHGIFGIFMAITGIALYSVVMFQHKKAQQEAQQEAQQLLADSEDKEKTSS